MNSHGNVAVLLHPLPIIHETRWCKYLIEIGVPLEFVNSLLVIQILFCLYFQGEIRHEPTGQCIDRGDKKGGGSLVVMNPCDGSSNQKWKFAHYNTTKHTTWYEYTVWKKHCVRYQHHVMQPYLIRKKLREAWDVNVVLPYNFRKYKECIWFALQKREFDLRNVNLWI